MNRRDRDAKPLPPKFTFMIQAEHLVHPSFRDRLALLLSPRKNLLVKATFKTQWKVGQFEPVFETTLTDEQIPAPSTTTT
jgi:hypothetical protein